MTNWSELRPTNSLRVMDLVSAAGVDVSDWANFAGGQARASSNPKYCYEWAFLEPNAVAVLNLWYDEIDDEDGRVSQDLSLRSRNARARKMDEVIQAAVKQNLPIRVIIGAGKKRDLADPQSPASRMSLRILDPIPWHVKSYDWETGQCLVVRGAGGLEFSDQFSLTQELNSDPKRRAVSGEAFVRDPVVRQRVLTRANGKCELCGQVGFKTSDGRVFLETHHVIPLADGGPDSVSNVAAICPNHHREAHYGEGRKLMQKKLQDYLRNKSGPLIG